MFCSRELVMSAADMLLSFYCREVLMRNGFHYKHHYRVGLLCVQGVCSAAPPEAGLQLVVPRRPLPLPPLQRPCALLIRLVCAAAAGVIARVPVLAAAGGKVVVQVVTARLPAGCMRLQLLLQ